VQPCSLLPADDQRPTLTQTVMTCWKPWGGTLALASIDLLQELSRAFRNLVTVMALSALFSPEACCLLCGERVPQ
jgi:hypothetical protein